MIVIPIVTLEFVFGVISILRLKVNENKEGFLYHYGDQMATQYDYYRTPND